MANAALALLKTCDFNFTVNENSSTNKFVVLWMKFENSNEVQTFVQEIVRDYKH